MGRKKAHTPEEIVAKLRQVEVLAAQGKTVAEAVRAIGFTEQNYDELLRAEVFNTLREAQVLIEQWRQHYCLASHARPPDPPNSRRLFGRGVSGLRTPHPRPVPHKSEESWGSPSQSSQVRSGPKVATWMARHRGLALVHPQLGWEALKRIEWSIRAPRPRHARATTPAQRVASKRAFDAP